VFRAKTTELRIIGIFALAPGMLNNSLFVMWGFLPLIVPVLIAASNRVTSLQNHATKQKGDPLQDRPQPSLS
jgi:ABC-type transport system involved in cytochrome c biogenesis permease component